MPIEGTRRGTATRGSERRHLQLHRDGTPLAFAPEEGPRRWLNLVVAVVGIILTFPLWLLIGLAIKLTSRGPVIYTQTRVGLDKRNTGIGPEDPRRKHDMGGRPFKIYKFRTMTVDAEHHTGPVWASKDDCRVTAVGKLLRQYRLDELPQLINVLRGDMNVVGPRPERPAIVADLRTRIPDYQSRHRVRPGITGHAQIHLEYDSNVEDVKQKVGYDLDYIRRQGFWADFSIMLQTLPVMFFRRGSR